MKLTEINDIILGKIELQSTSRFKDLPNYTNDIKEVISTCDGLYDKRHLQLTRSHTEFYKANPLLDAYISDWRTKGDSNTFKKELFYSMLCGVYVPSIPSELTSLFVLTRRECESPNQMISALDKSRMKKYLTQSYHSSKTYMKELLDMVWGYDVNLVTPLMPMVTNRGVVEIYISNINDILLCSPSILNILSSADDVKSLWYSKDKGIVIGEKEVPLRTLIHDFGIVTNDLDLRKVFMSNDV